jgi:hypothetical protein
MSEPLMGDAAVIRAGDWEQVEEIIVVRRTSRYVSAESYVVFEWQGTTAMPERRLVRGPAFRTPKA